MTVCACVLCCYSARFLEPVSPDEEGGVPPDDQLLTSLEVELMQDIRRTVGQLAATAWAQNNLPVPQVSQGAERGAVAGHVACPSYDTQDSSGDNTSICFKIGCECQYLCLYTDACQFLRATPVVQWI